MRASVVATVSVGGTSVGITKHAAQRWQERCRPVAPTWKAALPDLVRLIAACGRLEKRPSWARPSSEVVEEEQPAKWIVLGDIALPLARDTALAVTCVTRGEPSDRVLDRRRERRAERARVRSQIRQSGRVSQYGGVARHGAGRRKNTRS